MQTEWLGRIYKEIESRHTILFQSKRKGCHNLVFIDPFGLEFGRKSLERILNAGVSVNDKYYRIRSDIIVLFNSYGVGMQAHNVIHQKYDDRSLVKHLGANYYDYIKKYAISHNKRIEELTRYELSNILSNYYISIFREYDYIVRTVRLPLKLEAQQFDLIFACRRTRSGNPFLAAVDYLKNMLEETDYRLVDNLKRYIITGKLPGMLRYIIKDPEKALEEYKTARRYGIR